MQNGGSCRAGVDASHRPLSSQETAAGWLWLDSIVTWQLRKTPIWVLLHWRKPPSQVRGPMLMLNLFGCEGNVKFSYTIKDCFYKLKLDSRPVLQSCAVAKSDKLWWATGQSNLTDRMEDCSIGMPKCMKTKLWKLLLRSTVCMPSLIVQWFTFSYCAWLWNWLMKLGRQDGRLLH